jgi:putative transposase
MSHLLRRERGVNHKRVRRVMMDLGLTIKIRRRWIRTTQSNHGLGVYPNLVKDLRITRLNQVWAADLTYIRLGRGFVYLAVILDLYSRKVIGWAIGRRLSSELAQAALEMSLIQRGPVEGCVHHSDRGVQYASGDYVGALNVAGLKPSMSGKGNPYDNAYVESFMKTLKVENVYLSQYRSYEAVIQGISEFIEAVYNKKRLHSGLDYLSPNEFEANQKDAPQMSLLTPR